MILFDERGRQFEATLVHTSRDRIEVSLKRQKLILTESSLKLTIAQGYLKDRKMDGTVRQLTELGLSRWIPFMAERSVPTPDTKRLKARQKRWEKIVVEAVKQCRRGCIPEIDPVLTFDEMLACSENATIKTIFWENESKPVTRTRIPLLTESNPEAFIIIGPEGGLTQGEVDAAVAKGFMPAAMGPRIMKADTAVLAACVIMQYLYGDLGVKKS